MLELQFNQAEFVVTYRGVNIILLPKEFALFQFLFAHHQQFFSRERLLDAVWPMESPSDRTVDDHVYRLRKKLRCWEHLFSIDTLRGTGYRLTIKRSTDNVTFVDPKLNDDVVKLLNRYQLLGQGEAMSLLAKYQQVLGFQVDQTSEMYLRLISGDFHWVLENKQLSFWDRAIFLLHLYHIIKLDSEEVFIYYEKALTNNNMPASSLPELNFNSITLYIETGRYEQASELLSSAREQIESQTEDGMLVFLHVKELLLNILIGNERDTKQKIEQTEELLQHYPYLREKGLFIILKGLWLWRKGDWYGAANCFDAGLDVLRQSRFTPHYVFGLRTIVYYLNREIPDRHNIKSKYLHLWDRMKLEYDFANLEKGVVQELNAHL
ncbi:MAG TPA: winged helix-turn-helix domain-containing protein [Candidatus Deferrimicrobium sp.]|nr:winged helix-turn-helix domain-containing protein [Candidatus Deferrimicrobium sp.]